MIAGVELDCGLNVVLVYNKIVVSILERIGDECEMLKCNFNTAEIDGQMDMDMDMADMTL